MTKPEVHAKRKAKKLQREGVPYDVARQRAGRLVAKRNGVQEKYVEGPGWGKVGFSVLVWIASIALYVWVMF